ncbi:DUF6734 family protein [Aquimarina litoralis]|uniref:DUF6734 family protein n=1 Tax=Aquimarina litoralis TaxID=584605 RepID=UPI001C57D8E3|nr:DUF6734 family protein [Aquimarina litoralis]MBW1294477.1 hypothetical protein [Aquimarina litoralis]
MSIKIIQSFWTKPFLEQNDDESARFKAGWSSTNLFFYSALLSCLTFKKHYGNVIMYTDKYGNELLKEKLGIPYTAVYKDLEQLHDYPSGLWALGKILSYSLQDKPFIHADTDVFIWKRFPESFISKDLFFQNVEFNFPRYKEVLEVILREFINVPETLIKEYLKNGNINAFNAGVIGGNNTSFFKELAKQVFPFVNDNLLHLSKVDQGIFNMIYEQMLGMNLALENNLSTNALYKEMSPSFSKVMRFQLIPEKEYYIHTVGHGKKSPVVQEQIEARLRYEFHDEYYNLKESLDKNGLSDNDFKGVTEKRFQYLKKHFDWLKNTSWNEKMNTKFILNPNITCRENENNEVVLYYNSPQELKDTSFIVEDWDFFLFYFEEANSIKNAASEAYANESISSQMSKEQLEERLFSMVMDRCMFNEILLFYESVK